MIVMGIGLGAAILTTQPTLRTDQVDVTWKRLGALEEAIDRYRVHHKGLPPSTSLDQLVSQGGEANCTVDTDPSSSTYRKMLNWCGPYIDPVFQQDASEFQRDGWGSTIEYDTVSLRSCGANRVCGDGDDLVESL